MRCHVVEMSYHVVKQTQVVHVAEIPMKYCAYEILLQLILGILYIYTPVLDQHNFFISSIFMFYRSCSQQSEGHLQNV